MTTWSSGTVHNMTLPGGFNNLKKTFVIMRLDGSVGTVTSLDRHEHWVRDNLTSYQFMLQGQYFPQDAVDVSSALLQRDSWNRFLREVNAHTDHFPPSYGGIITEPEYNCSAYSGVYKFIMVMNWETDSDQDVLSGIAVGGSTGDRFRLILKGSAPSAALRVMA